jgi:lipopolysaccharide transport system ATP-binding protein
MHVRLGFAVAAHLTPEVLIVDEVLAVGDYEFQRRCLGRMSEVARSGRTVLFVSHNLKAVEDLCPRAILLRQGTIAEEGPARQVIGHYLARRAGEARGDLAQFTDREGNGKARITKVEVRATDDGRDLEQADFLEPLVVRVHYRASERFDATVGLALLSEADERVFVSETEDVGLRLPGLDGSGVIECVIKSMNLLPGTYRLEVWIIDMIGPAYADHIRGVSSLQVQPGKWSDGNWANLARPGRGHVYVPCSWRVA